MSLAQFLTNLEELNVHIDVIDDKLKIQAPEGKLTPALINELKDKKQEIIDFLQKKVQKQKYIAIEPAVEKEFYELSSAQMRMYFLQQMNLSSTVYNITYFEKLGDKGNKNKGTAARIDVKRLEDTFKRLIERHESLRTSFHLAANKPVQKIHREVDFKIEHYNKVVDFVRSFDLSQAPLIRVGIIATGAEGLILGIDMHHIICDGSSVNILVREFTYMYGYAHSDNHGLPQLRIQYKEYAEWQNSEMQRILRKKQEVYWLKEFFGEIPTLELPTDFHRPHIQSLDGNRLHFKIPAEKALVLTNIATKNGATLYTILLSIFYILMTKLSGQVDIVLGTPTAGRRHADLEGVIGMFVNTLALRNYPSGGKTFKAFLQEVNRRTQEAFENQDYQFEDMVEKLVLKRDAARNPLFDVMFSWLDIDSKENTGAGSVENEAPQNGFSNYVNPQSRFDITWNGVGSKEHFFFLIEYCTKLFKEETILQFIEFFKNIISLIIENPDRKISQIEIITEEEKKQVLIDFNNTGRAYPKEKPIHGLFEEKAAKIPDSIAVIAPATTMDIQLSYCELNERSVHLAVWLKEKGVEPDTIVGIMAEGSVEMIFGIIGVLKAGGAYLPIDPNYPRERIDFMLKDSGAKLLVTTNDKEGEKVGRWEGEKVLLKEISKSPKISSYPLTLLPSYLQIPSNLAYVIYTSGSTGIPKGVMVNHQNVVRLVMNTNYIEFKEGIRLLQTGALGFDASTFEIWGSLLNGLLLCLVEKETILLLGRLKKSVKKYDIAIMWMTSPLFNQISRLDSDVFSNLTHLIVGGDVLSITHINRLKKEFPRLKISNGYGPTENTTFSTTYLIEKEHVENIPIGRPIANSTAFIVDKNNHLQPVGVPGELVLGGDGVARGYLNDPELTAEKFIDFHHSSCTLHQAKLYRSLDLCRWQADGNIEFIGRIDQQVKIRGFRIELEEIEKRLTEHHEIKEAVIIDLVDEKQEKYLCAYIVSRKKLSISQLREYLTGKLPDYMIPLYFVRIEKMPLTANGKIDRKALPAPIIEPGGGYVAPQNDMEEKLVEIWAEVLGIEKTKIGIDHNFFELGGNSLRLISLVGKIYKEFKIDVPIIAQIYNEPRIRDMAIFMTKSNLSEQPVVLLNWKRPKKIFCLPDQNGFGYGYGSLGFLLDDYSLYTLTYIEDEDRINRYVDIITGIQPNGPYVFFGHSAAGKLTFVIAAALEKLGFEVSDIVFADSLFAENLAIDLTEEYLKEFRSGVEDFLKGMNAEFLLEKVFAKAKKYMEYWNTIVTLEKVNANIHLILSEEVQQSTESYIDPHCWDKLTIKTSRIYNGWGGHRDMLAGWALEKNIDIIKKILVEANFGKESLGG